jgi:hypothetical protein
VYYGIVAVFSGSIFKDILLPNGVAKLYLKRKILLSPCLNILSLPLFQISKPNPPFPGRLDLKMVVAKDE